ncbi:MAG: hypothetical protein Q4A04_01230 [Eubacteriales bacterium]|nr:hypothetical protein [Eubacteriales bacterium]
MWIAASFSSYAATVYTEDAFYYTIEDRSITITGYFGDDAVVNVPSMIAGLPVNHIAPYAFEGTGVTIVNLPETIESVEKSAFDASTQVNYFQREETTRPNLGDDTDPDDASGEVETLPTGPQESTEEETSPAESQGSTEEETSPAESQSGSEEEPTSSQQETETTATGTGGSSSGGSSSAGGYVSDQVSDDGLSAGGPASARKNAGEANTGETNAIGTGADGTNASAADAVSTVASAAGTSGQRQGSADDSGSRESQDSALSGHVEEVVEDDGFFAGEEPEVETIEERPSAVETAGTSPNESAGTESSTGKLGTFGIFAAVIALCLFLVFFITRKKKKEQ